MKRIGWLWQLLLVGVLATLSLGAEVRTAASSSEVQWVPVPVYFDSAGTQLTVKFIGDENDTVRTKAIDFTDCDWSVLDAATTVKGGIRIFAEVTTQNTATDTLNFFVEQGSGKSSAAVFAYRGKAIDAVPGIYNTMVTQSDAAGAFAAGRFFAGFLQVDADARGADNVWLSPYNRLKLCGDISGTTPKVGIKLWVVYPKRFYTR